MLTRRIKSALRRVGFELHRITEQEPIILPGNTGADVFSLLYYNANANVLVSASALDLRDPFFHTLSRASNHPYYVAVKAALDAVDKHRVIFDTLRRYYESAQPETAADYLGLAGSTENDLHRQPPWAFVWPWVTDSPGKRAAYERAIRKPVPRHSLGTGDLSTFYGWKYAGPAEEPLIYNETLRLVDLMASIERSGYQRNDGQDGDAAGSALIKDSDNVRFSLSTGLHRVAVAAALGETHIPVRVRSIIRLEDSRLWPNVVNGLYSQEEAEQVFLRLFDGRPAPSLKHWNGGEERRVRAISAATT